MDTTIDSLKKLYVALGGNSATVANITLIPDMINALCTVVPGAANLLPAVTATENGKILKVVNGEWALADDATE